MSEVEVRQGCEADIPFIFSTWLRSYRDNSFFAKRIKNSIFFDGHHKVIEHLLQKPGLQVLVAHAGSDANTIFGYLVTEPAAKVVHFAYVKKSFRRLGIAKALLDHFGADLNECQFTHWTFDLDSILPKFPLITYNPYAL